MKQFLNAAEIARLLGVDKSTVVKWIKKGYFEPHSAAGRERPLSHPAYLLRGVCQQK